jgi:16S rRNA G527 N7-methylase RsmG
MRWNSKINLTAIRTPEECVTRHFGESMFVVPRDEPLGGRLLDVGSGAGFPGLALKLAVPELKHFLHDPAHISTARPGRGASTVAGLPHLLMRTVLPSAT